MPPLRSSKTSTTDDARSTKPAPATATPQPTVARAIDPAELSAASPAQLRQLNRSVGNRAVNRMLAGAAVQAKLTVGPADDPYEREADRTADAVMHSAPGQSAAPEPVQRMGVDEEDEPVQRVTMEDDEPVQRMGVDDDDEAVQRRSESA